MRSEQSWSMIDPRPVLLYVENVDSYIVYWNGVAMTHTMALCMTMEHFGIYATPEMKTSLEKDYERVYYSNAFKTRAWDKMVAASPIYPYLKRIMTDHLKKVLVNKEAKEVLGWFNYTKARKENDNS